jgi:nucleoid-associated protein YgaU
VLLIESLDAPPAPLSPPPGDADVIDLRLGRVPAPTPVLVEPVRTPPPAGPPAGRGAQAGAGPPRVAAPPGRDDPSDYYVVQPGDTLSTIAQAQLGSATKAAELMQLNRLRDADAIVVGQVLRLR